ncbi:hypothetical protein [Streptomyces sp. NBC_01800]|uniref:hypothetical protein n=1 Tax=Streptomyces sp. NBC_01800 TaxID=2975945 RepID=UPI003FA37D9D
MRVARLAACVNGALYPSTAIATVKLLEHLGADVDFPVAQTCCHVPQQPLGGGDVAPFQGPYGAPARSVALSCAAMKSSMREISRQPQ